MGKGRIKSFSLKKVGHCLILLLDKFDDEIPRGPPLAGVSNYGGVVFNFTTFYL